MSARLGRRGAAMVTAIWLMVALSAAALHFALASQERVTLGIAAYDRATGRAAAVGALAVMQASLDQALVNTAQNGASVAGTRRADAWLDADSIFSGPLAIDSTSYVDVQVADMGAFFNINTATQIQMTSFMTWFLGTDGADLSAAIMDWRDVDQNRLIGGAEKDDYLKDGLLALPRNGPFREPGDLLQVAGMTQEIYDAISPYLTTYGTGAININSAPEPVLRSITGMSDAIVNTIMVQRGNGLRITNAATVTGGPALAGTTTTSTQLMLTFVTRMNESAVPVKMRALVSRAGTTTTIGWKQW